MTKLQLQVLEDLKSQLVEKFKIVQIRALKGSPHAGNDGLEELHVFIVLKEHSWEIETEIYKICYEAEVRNGIAISPVIHDRDELQSLPVEHLPFYQAVVERGIAI